MKRLRFLFIIPIFLCFIIVYVISNAFLRRDEPLIHDYIPDEVDVLVEFDIKHFGSAFMYNMLYNSDYFNEKIPMPDRKSRRDLPSIGVSPSSNFVLAVERWGTGDFFYLIFELNSQNEFNDFMINLQDKNKNLVHVSNSEVGIFGFANNVDKNSAQKYLVELVNKNVESIRTKYDLKEKFNWDRDVNVHVNTQAYIEGSKLQDIFASVDLVSSDALMEIEYLSNAEYKVKPIKGKVLKSKNLHFSSTMKLKDVLKTFGMEPSAGILDFPEIKKWSVNNLGSLFEIEYDVKLDSIEEIYRVKSSFGDVLVDGKEKLGIYIPAREQRISLNTQDKFELLLQPESAAEFNKYFTFLSDSGYVFIDTAKNIMKFKHFGEYKYKWVDDLFVLFPSQQDDVEMVELAEQGSYFYMDFDLNPFFENIEMKGGTTIESFAFSGIMDNILQLLSNFDRSQVSLYTEGGTIKIKSKLSFKNSEGVAIIEMMSAFLNSNFKGFFF